MLEETPAWTFTSKRPLTRWFEHVHLLHDRVVGYWFCLDRSSGTRLWERRLRLAEIAGIEDGIIVANERYYVCDISAPRRGCCGISLETGKLLWTPHGSSIWGRLLSLFHSEAPLYVLNGRCYCLSGRVFDIRTGRSVERVPKEEVQPPEEPESDTDILGRSRDPSDPVKLRVGDGLWLSHKSPSEPVAETEDEFPAWVWEFRLFLTDDEGRVKWQFDLKNTGYEICYCPYVDKCRYSAPYLYLVACEKRTTTMQRKIEVYNPTQFHLLTLDLATGCIAQDIQVTRNPVDVCRFEDIDENGVLVSESDRILHYFEKS